jgi:hypothetical protein
MRQPVAGAIHPGLYFAVQMQVLHDRSHAVILRLSLLNETSLQIQRPIKMATAIPTASPAILIKDDFLFLNKFRHAIFK